MTGLLTARSSVRWKVNETFVCVVTDWLDILLSRKVLPPCGNLSLWETGETPDAQPLEQTSHTESVPRQYLNSEQGRAPRTYTKPEINKQTNNGHLEATG